jgi:O-antigen/teichoic acid export membrane protein
MAFLYLFSDEIITIIFTKKWLPASNYFKLFCIIGAFYPIHSINVSILNAQGRSDYFLKLEIIKKVLFLLIIFLTFKYEVKYMLIGQIVFSITSLFINSYFTNKLINYSLSEQLIDISPYFFVTIIMTIALYLFKKINIINNIYLFILVEVTLALILYTLICYILKLKYFNRFVDIILKYRFIW